MSDLSNKEISDLTTCQNCGVKSPNLVTVDSGLKLTLASSGSTEIPSLVCGNCLKTLKKSASLGSQLKAKEEAKIHHLNSLWKVRFDVVKQARASFQHGEYANSAILYEKYLKILTMAFEKEKTDLVPTQFSDNPKEITIIVSVLWDLMLIYDSHIKFADKQRESAEMLAKFLRFSPMYNTIVRKAELQVRQGKNATNFRYLLKLCDSSASRCFVANSAFNTRTDPTVRLLCEFRDQYLKQNTLGRVFVMNYYRRSPSVALFLDQNPKLKPLVRSLLRAVASLLAMIFNLPARPDSSSL